MTVQAELARRPGIRWPEAAGKSVIAWLLAATIALSLFVPAGHDQQRLLQIGCLLIGSAWVLASGRFTTLAASLAPAARWCLALFFMLGAASALLAYSVMHAWLDIAHLMLMLVVAFALAQDMRRDFSRALSILLALIGAACALYFLRILVFCFAALTTHIPPDLFVFAPSFSNFRFLNHVQTVLLPLLILGACLPGARRRAFFLVAACWWSLVYLLEARGTSIALAGGVVLSLALARRKAWPFVRSFLATAALGGLVYGVLFVLLPTLAGMEPFSRGLHVLQRSMENPASNRGVLWQQALDMMAAHPWLGSGPMHFSHEVPSHIQFASPHSWVMQIGAEWGLPALLMLVIVIAFAWRGLLRKGMRLPADDGAGQLLFSAWVVTGCAVLVDGLVSGNMVLPVSQLAIVLFLGMAMGWSGGHEAGQSASPGRAGRAVVCAVIGAAMVQLVAGAYHAAQPSGERADLYRPRYWLRGHF
jgi:putative inorganic carbon (hco3(-)) transporter